MLGLNFELKRKDSEIRELKLETARKPRGSKLKITCNELLRILDADAHSASGELELVYRHGASSDMSSYGPAQWIFQHGEFQDWLATNASQLLLIEGNMSTHTLERISPTSYICAVFLQTLKNIPRQASIYFFCGLHSTWNSPFPSARGLMRSLIAQLISLFDFELDFIRSQKILDEIKTHEPDHLFKLFRNLVKRLPEDTVLFCIIDGIFHFETEEWMHEACFIVRKFRELAEDDQIGTVFKLLLINPIPTRHVSEHIGTWPHLLVPRDVDESQRGLSERQVMMHTHPSLMSGMQEVEESSEDENMHVDEGYNSDAFSE